METAGFSTIATATSNAASVVNPAVLPEGTQIVPLHRVVSNKDRARTFLKLESFIRQVSIHGITKPLIVAPAPQRLNGEPIYIIQDGERRRIAAQKLGYKEIPISIIEPLPDLDALTYQLVSNKNRKDLSVIDEAEGILKLLMGRLNLPEREVKILLSRLGHTERETGNHVMPEQKATVTKVLESMGMSLANYRQNLLPFLRHPDDVREAFRAGLIPRTHAKLLGKVPDAHLRGQLLNDVQNEGLSFNQLRCRLDDAEALEARLDDEDLAVMQKMVESLFLKLKETWIWGNMATLADFEKNLQSWVTHEQPEEAAT